MAPHTKQREALPKPALQLIVGQSEHALLGIRRSLLRPKAAKEADSHGITQNCLLLQPSLCPAKNEDKM
jgi:hypothetical protein